MYQEFNPPCRREFARRLSGYLAVLAALLLTIVAPSAYAANACNVVYTISPQNTSQFGATITIKNNGSTALSELVAYLDLRQRPDHQRFLEWHCLAERRQRHSERTVRPDMGEHSGQRKLLRIRLQRHLERHHQRSAHLVRRQRNDLWSEVDRHDHRAHCIHHHAKGWRQRHADRHSFAFRGHRHGHLLFRHNFARNRNAQLRRGHTCDLLRRGRNRLADRCLRRIDDRCHQHFKRCLRDGQRGSNDHHADGVHDHAGGWRQRHADGHGFAFGGHRDCHLLFGHNLTRNCNAELPAWPSSRPHSPRREPTR